MSTKSHVEPLPTRLKPGDRLEGHGFFTYWANLCALFMLKLQSWKEDNRGIPEVECQVREFLKDFAMLWKWHDELHSELNVLHPLRKIDLFKPFDDTRKSGPFRCNGQAFLSAHSGIFCYSLHNKLDYLLAPPRPVQGWDYNIDQEAIKNLAEEWKIDPRTFFCWFGTPQEVAVPGPKGDPVYTLKDPPLTPLQQRYVERTRERWKTVKEILSEIPFDQSIETELWWERKQLDGQLPAKPAPVVFVSSTSEDLEEYRKKVEQTILDLGFVPRMQEHFAASGHKPPLPLCLEKVLGSPKEQPADVVVLIVAHRCGWTPDDQPDADCKSITWLECEEARKNGKEVLAFVINKDHPWPPEFIDREPKKVDCLEQFKKWVDEFLHRKTFTTSDSLCKVVAAALHDWHKRR